MSCSIVCYGSVTLRVGKTLVRRGGYYVIGLHFSGRALSLVDGGTGRSLFVGWVLALRGGGGGEAEVEDC